MKNLVSILALVFLIACNTETKQATASDEYGSAEVEETKSAERSIGFATALPELKWHLGKEDAIEIVKNLDAVWAKKDYEALREFFVDTTKFYFDDGQIVNSPDEFIEILKKGDAESESSWTFDYAFSVDLDPTQGGEHVQAGFSGTSVKDGETTKKKYHESYYIIDGKVVAWNQYTRVDTEEEEEEQ